MTVWLNIFFYGCYLQLYMILLGEVFSVCVVPLIFRRSNEKLDFFILGKKKKQPAGYTHTHICSNVCLTDCLADGET